MRSSGCGVRGGESCRRIERHLANVRLTAPLSIRVGCRVENRRRTVGLREQLFPGA